MIEYGDNCGMGIIVIVITQATISVFILHIFSADFE